MKQCLVLLIVHLVHCRVFRLGYITGSKRRPWDQSYSRPGMSFSGAISFAVDFINSNKAIVEDGMLMLTVAETYGEEDESIRQTARLWRDNITAIIGPQETCVHEAKLAASFSLPMISYYCTNYETSNKKDFPTFARTRPPDTQISKSVASVLLNFNWTKIAFLYNDNDDSLYKEIADGIVPTLVSFGIEVKFILTWSAPHATENEFIDIIDNTHKDIRIYVIFGHYYEHVDLLAALESKQLLEKGEYFVVGVDLQRYESDNPVKYMHSFYKEEPEPQVVEAFKSYIGIMSSPPLDFELFSHHVNRYSKLPPFHFEDPLASLGGLKRAPVEAAYLFDAIMLYAAAVNDTILANEDPFNGTQVSLRMRNRTLDSAMGYSVYIDENGDAAGNFTLVGRRPHHNHPNDYGIYPIGIFKHMTNKTLPDLDLTASIVWPGGSPPLDEPLCGFKGEYCISHTVEITISVIGILLLIALIIGLITYRNWRYEQELDSLLWKIDFKDVKPIELIGSTSLSQAKIKESQLSLLSSGEKEFRVNNFCPVAFYRGRLCAIKVIRRKDVEITREIKKELKLMRDLHHDNLVAFIGASVEPPNICTLTEYCSRGSLKDILENDDFQLDKMFVASLVDDLIRGMIFLHDSPIRSHGNLKTSNCLVNSRWVLKISDFGLYDLDISGESNADRSEEVNEGELYRAPELLRNLSQIRSGTQPGDVYSFAMILYEIHSRGKLYDDYGLSITDILERIKEASKYGQPLRPRLERIMNVPNFVLQTVCECWNEDPTLRPDFKIIRVKLRPLKKGMKANIFDNMLAMMEKYANNLEMLVDERTEMLIEEKQKTDSLLYEMLPRFVADQLKKGMKVQAESYDAVTIYFSDIVGFTDMSAHSTPLQVVDFLNDLYTCFDSIIGFYDVYKVETIGDAYMVVSGLPVRNGEQHAAEIASMSLHLLQAVKHFKIRHRPTDILMLRIGIHTGPVCAGVVGLKMPRYCLFGDTVNTSSRMESTGVPLKVHCSSECKLLLDKLGGYQFEKRGPVKMKGKGEKLTYWLIGQETECRTHSVHPINSPSQNCSSEPQLSTVARNRQSFRRGIVNLTLEACLSDDQFTYDVTSLAVPNDDSHRRTSAPFIFGISSESTATPKKTIFCWKNEKSKSSRTYDHSPLLLSKKENCN